MELREMPNTEVSCDVTQSFVSVSDTRRFGETWCLQLYDKSVKDGCSYTASVPTVVVESFLL
jgi:hypothetical protein